MRILSLAASMLLAASAALADVRSTSKVYYEVNCDTANDAGRYGALYRGDQGAALAEFRRLYGSACRFAKTEAVHGSVVGIVPQAPIGKLEVVHDTIHAVWVKLAGQVHYLVLPKSESKFIVRLAGAKDGGL